MPLTLIATPIGKEGEISKSALNIIPELDLLICESRKETSRLLRGLGVSVKEYAELNEHSDSSDVKELVEKCRSSSVGLVSDCGTPGFCDPGALLVRKCRDSNIAVHSLPGPSSLMAFFSICGYRVDEFYFKGFLSPNTEERKRDITKLKKSYQCPILLMDTPYRLGKLLKELCEQWPNSYLVLGCQLGLDEESLFEGTPQELEKKLNGRKFEFVLMLASSRDELLKGFS